MNIDEKIKGLPEEVQEQVNSFLDIVVHTYRKEKQVSDQLEKELDEKKIKIIYQLMKEKEIDLLLNIENILFPQDYQLSKWEEEQLEKGWQDFFRKIHHKTR